MRDTDLVRHHREGRALPLRWLDRTSRLFGPTPTPEDEIDAMVERLEKRLGVWATDGTVSIGLDWSDPQMAARIVDLLQKSFLDTRHAQEITTLVESAAIVRGHAGALQRDVDDAVVALEKLRGPARPAVATAMPVALVPGSAGPAVTAARVAPRAPVLPRTTGARPAPSADASALQLEISTKSRSIEGLEDARRRKLADAESRYREQRATLTEKHPVVIELQRAVSVLESPAPEVTTMRRELSTMQAEHTRLVHAATPSDPTPTKTSSWTTGVTAAGAGGMPPQVPSEIMRLDSELREDRDPMTVYARAQLRDAMERYSALRAQVQSTQIELETAEAAFKYRYRVLSPAQVPKRPTKPNVALLMALATFAAGLAAMVIVTVADVRAGRLVERWQLDALVGAPIVAELDVPQTPHRESA